MRIIQISGRVRIVNKSSPHYCKRGIVVAAKGEDFYVKLDDNGCIVANITDLKSVRWDKNRPIYWPGLNVRLTQHGFDNWQKRIIGRDCSFEEANADLLEMIKVAKIRRGKEENIEVNTKENGFVLDFVSPTDARVVTCYRIDKKNQPQRGSIHKFVPPPPALKYKKNDLVYVKIGHVINRGIILDVDEHDPENVAPYKVAFGRGDYMTTATVNEENLSLVPEHLEGRTREWLENQLEKQSKN